MNFFDFLIIYLACGAPVSVYFYFQNRRFYSKQLWLKTILNFVFWIPFFVQIILKSRKQDKFPKSGFKSKINLDAKVNRIQTLKREIEKILSGSDLEISIYEFREVFERFAGLTTASLSNKTKPYKHEREFFGIAGFQNQELSAGCLHRRNQKRLYFHQTEAERDFLQMIAAIAASINKPAELSRLTVEFVKLLNNPGAQMALIKIFDAELQTDRKNPVTDLEKDLWMPEIHKPQPVNQISMRLRAINKTAKLSAKD